MATYYIDFESSRTRAALESAKLEKDVRCLVRREENPSAPSIVATGKLSADGMVFDVFVGDEYSHSWTWEWLQEKLSLYR
jgi:hypothetical protein